MTKQLAFKRLAEINLAATIVGVIASIVAAHLGWGVWSLVLKIQLTSIITALLLWYYNSWRPSLVFSYSSFKELFNFGGLMLLSSLLNTLFENIQSLIIGRLYSAKDLGLYTQAKRTDELPSRSISQIVTQVSFPVFSKVADNTTLLVNSVRKNILCTTFLLFPLQFLLIVIAKPLFIVLFTEKWLASVPYFQIICVYSMFISLNAINTNIYKALGRSKIYFWVQLIKKIIAILLLIIGLHYDIIGITWSVSISGILWWFISASVNQRILGYGLWAQIKDIGLSFICSGVVALLTWYILVFYFPFGSSYLFSILCGCTIYIIAYIFITSLLRLEPVRLYTDIISSLLHKK
jgi:O-antigen/teichoic acid export membrane protein